MNARPPALYLASSSPRRVELLHAAGIHFVQVAPGPEPDGHGSPRELAEQRARSKAQPSPRPAGSGFLLGVDTVVELDGVEFGKAADAGEAAAMLDALAGRTHAVHTAHCLVDLARGTLFERTCTASVRCERDAAAIARYVQSGDWQGKAGAYGIQDPDCTFMTLVAGDLDVVVGLSVAAVRALIAAAGPA